MEFDSSTLAAAFSAVAVAVAVAGAAVAVAGAANGRRRRARVPQAPPHPLPAPVVERARAVLAQGRRIQAIKELREATGYDLRTAKDVADAIGAGIAVPTLAEPNREGAGLAARVRDLRDRKGTAEAISLVAEETGMNEAEAAHFVRSLD
ncbi:hypothetical protein [Streptomonospora wellingtoniae]|uniref:Ribosomal protein L7/L12 C-terminal domain-containing protein n=1 Tax=Streptomonospora wellingtoniae TaxID=3075544 RepID=A0ABU2KTA5_9ACTN|nr:hypothetical protein [Streptomonospora sp. DSM 45055]MDT0302526.1 hypothetical protein [Streptomonospora sp. DSM 45055]